MRTEALGIVRKILAGPDGITTVDELGLPPAMLTGWRWLRHSYCDDRFGRSEAQVPDWYVKFPPGEFGYRVVGAAAWELYRGKAPPPATRIELVGHSRETAEAFLKSLSGCFTRFSRTAAYTALDTDGHTPAVHVGHRLWESDSELLESSDKDGRPAAWDGRNLLAAKYQAEALREGFMFSATDYSSLVLSAWPQWHTVLHRANIYGGDDEAVACAGEWLAGGAAQVCDTISAEISQESALQACVCVLPLAALAAECASRAACASQLTAAVASANCMKALAGRMRDALRGGIGIPWRSRSSGGAATAKQALAELLEFEIESGQLVVSD